MASLPDISVIRNAVPKPQTWFTAENSWMSSVAFMILVAATHFIPLSTKSHQYEEQQKRLKEASAGAKKLFSLVLKANFNMPLFVIRPPYNCSTDDTTTYTYVGEGQTKVTFLLVSRSALKSASTLSIAATPPNIKHGFVQNGMADKIRHEFPDYDALLTTCRINPEVADYELTEKSFPLLIQQQFDEGHIPDTMLEHLGFPKDKDMDGNEVRPSKW